MGRAGAQVPTAAGGPATAGSATAAAAAARPRQRAASSDTFCAAARQCAKCWCRNSCETATQQPGRANSSHPTRPAKSCGRCERCISCNTASRPRRSSDQSAAATAAESTRAAAAKTAAATTAAAPTPANSRQHSCRSDSKPSPSQRNSDSGTGSDAAGRNTWRPYEALDALGSYEPCQSASCHHAGRRAGWHTTAATWRWRWNTSCWDARGCESGRLWRRHASTTGADGTRACTPFDSATRRVSVKDTHSQAPPRESYCIALGSYRRWRRQHWSTYHVSGWRHTWRCHESAAYPQNPGVQP